MAGTNAAPTPQRGSLYPTTAQQSSPLGAPGGHRPQQLTADRIRNTRFPFRWRRGYDPNAVHEYLGQVADELLHLQQQLARVHAENDRIKRHLRQWQTEHAGTCRTIQGRRNDSDWPINRR